MSEIKKIFEQLSPANQEVLLMTAQGMAIAEEETKKQYEESKQTNAD